VILRPPYFSSVTDGGAIYVSVLLAEEVYDPVSWDTVVVNECIHEEDNFPLKV